MSEGPAKASCKLFKLNLALPFPFFGASTSLLEEDDGFESGAWEDLGLKDLGAAIFEGPNRLELEAVEDAFEANRFG